MLKPLHIRISAPVLFVVLLLTPTVVQAQNPDISRRISVRYSGIPLEEVLRDLEKNGVKFSYSKDIIPVSTIISYIADNKTLEQVMAGIFQQAGIEYTLVNGYFVLQVKKVPSPIKQTKSEMYSVSGTIADSATGEIMIGAAVYLNETGKGIVTNSFGFFSITLPKGNYVLQASYLGYQTKSKPIALKENLIWNVRLKQVPLVMKEIIINSIDKDALIFNMLAAQTNVDPATVQRQPAPLGETDMLKALDNLPGISFQSEGSSYFYVRGGNRDQNMILLDDAPVFNPTHLLGLFTPIIPEAIKHATVYKADFPVQYGGRLSSVIDIRAKDGNMNHISGSASLSAASTRFSLEGPFRKQSSSWFLSFRVSTIGLLVKAVNPSVERFFFADFTSKFNIKLGQRDRLYLTLFSGKDAFINKSNEIRSGLEWGNTTATLRWSHVYGSRLFSNTTLYTSKYDYALYTDYDKKNFWNSDITGSNLSTEFSWYINPRNSLKFGLNAGGYFFNPGNYKSPDASLDTMRVSEVNSGELVLYAGNELELTHWLHLAYGLRLSNWSNYGEAFSIVYDNTHQPLSYHEFAKGERYYSKSYIEPRISLSVRTGAHESVKASYNRTTQHINQINNSISPFNSLEVWLPSGPNIKPMFAHIFDLGFVKNWPAVSLDLSADVYYKRMYNQLGYSPHAEMFLNPYLEGELRQGDGSAYGFEVMLKKTQGRLTGQLGYAFNRSWLTIEELNYGKTYPAHQDRPVDLSLSADYKLKTRWTINLNLVYTSGMTISTPTSFYYYRGTQVPVYAEMNNSRLPAYRRLDIGSAWRLNKKEGAFSHYFTFTLYNIFDARNFAFLNFNKIQGVDGKFYVPADKQQQNNQVVTYRYIYSVVPSFTYNLQF